MADSFDWGQFGALAGAGASLIAGSGTKYKKRTKNAINRLVRPQLDRYMNQQERSLQQAKQESVGGYQAALGETQDIGTTGARRILQQSRAASGAIDQNLASRGLGGTTVQNSLQRGLRESTQRSLDTNDAAFAQLRAQLQTGLGNAAAQGDVRLAEHYGLRWQAEYNAVWQNILGINSGGRLGAQYNPQQFASAPVDGSGIGDAVQSAIQIGSLLL